MPIRTRFTPMPIHTIFTPMPIHTRFTTHAHSPSIHTPCPLCCEPPRGRACPKRPHTRVQPHASLTPPADFARHHTQAATSGRATGFAPSAATTASPRAHSASTASRRSPRVSNRREPLGGSTVALRAGRRRKCGRRLRRAGAAPRLLPFAPSLLHPLPLSRSLLHPPSYPHSCMHPSLLKASAHSRARHESAGGGERCAPKPPDQQGSGSRVRMACSLRVRARFVDGGAS